MKVPILAILALILASFACGQYVTPVPTASPVPDTAVPATETQEAVFTVTASASIAPEAARVTAAQSLHVRVRPGEQQAVIGYLYHSDVIYLSGKCQTGWAQIQWRGGVAWVKASFLSENKCQTN